MLDVTILIVNYNACAYLRNCLSSLYEKGSRYSWETLVVDNGSTDGSLRMLRHFPQVRVIANAENRGFARANNQGIEASAGRYILLVNPDVVLLDPVDRLIDFMDGHPHCGIAGGRVLNPDQTIQHTCRSFPSLALLPFGRESPLTRIMPRNRWSRQFLCRDLKDGTETQVDAVGGVFMAIRRKLLDEIGGFDERFFLFVEDTDLCYTARKHDWQVYYAPFASVIHFGGRSTRSVRTRSVYHHYRGIYRFFEKHYALKWHERGLLLGEMAAGYWSYLAYSSMRQLRR